MARWSGALALVVFGCCAGLCGTSIASDKPVTAGNSSAAPAGTFQSRLERVRAQVESGECGPALEIAQPSEDPAEGGKLLQLAAQAQAARGESSSARRTAARMPTAESRGGARAELARHRASAGGGTGADFGPLID